MQYEAPAIEDLGSIADHTFMHAPGLVNHPLNPFPGQGLGLSSHGSGPS